MNQRDFYSFCDSQSQQFSDFLLRANRYCGLDILGETQPICSDKKKKLVLVEDLPNFVLHDPAKLHAILRYE